MVRNFADYHLAREQPRMVSLSSRIQVPRDCFFRFHLNDSEGVKTSSTSCGGLPGVPRLSALLLSQAATGRRGWRKWWGGRPEGGGGLWASSHAGETGTSDLVNDTKTNLVEFQIRVDVYYEVLCPDSRYFVQHELWPSYQKYWEEEKMLSADKQISQVGRCSWC